MLATCMLELECLMATFDPKACRRPPPQCRNPPRLPVWDQFNGFQSFLIRPRPDKRPFAYVRAQGGEPTRITREDGSYVDLKYDSALRLTNEIFYAAGS